MSTDAPRVDPVAHDESVRIAWRSPVDAEIVVAGVDVAPLCRSVRLDLDAEEMPRIFLELDPMAVTADLLAADVEIDRRTADVLEALGWTPPSGWREDRRQDRTEVPPVSDTHITLTVDTELQRGHVYAVRIPDGHDVLDYTDPLRELHEATGARLVVFRDGATVQELEATAVVDADAAIAVARAEAERLRGLLGQALRGWRIDAVHARCGCHDATCSCIFGEPDRIHREASL